MYIFVKQSGGGWDSPAAAQSDRRPPLRVFPRISKVGVCGSYFSLYGLENGATFRYSNGSEYLVIPEIMRQSEASLVVGLVLRWLTSL